MIHYSNSDNIKRIQKNVAKIINFKFITNLIMSLEKSIFKLISIEGNIGSGKSTLLNLLIKQAPKLIPINQPLEQWKRLNILNLYYQDPHRYGLTFQTFTLFSRIKTLGLTFNHHRHQENLRFISQRSIEADREIFAKLLRQKGYLNQTEYKLYQFYYNGYQDLLGYKKIDKYIYLQCSPQLCYMRIAKRNRMEQNNNKISLQYLNEINEKHEEWLNKKQDKLILNGNLQFENDEKLIQKMMKAIQQFVDK